VPCLHARYISALPDARRGVAKAQGQPMRSGAGMLITRTAPGGWRFA
jgi:hypothetical protein